MTQLSRTLIGCILVTACALAVHAESPSGRWEGTINVPGNPIAITGRPRGERRRSPGR